MDGSQRCNAVLHDSLTLIPSTPNKATEITMKQPRLPAYVVGRSLIILIDIEAFCLYFLLKFRLLKSLWLIGGEM